MDRTYRDLEPVYRESHNRESCVARTMAGTAGAPRSWAVACPTSRAGRILRMLHALVTANNELSRAPRDG